MAINLTIKIPFNRIEKIGIWSNEKEKTTLQKIYAQLKEKYPEKEIYISNAGFFSMCSTIPAVFGLKADNKIYSNDWSYPYIGIKNNKEIKFCKANESVEEYTDAVSGYPALIENGKKSKNFSHCVDNSDRGRTCIGYNKKEIILSCMQDISGKSDWTLDEELSFMLNQGCEYAINLDGGGSVQCNFNGATIKSTRKVSNFIYIIAKIDESKENLIKYKQEFQEWLNEQYNAKISVDGSFGNLTLKATIKALQNELKVTADGLWGSKSKKAYSKLETKERDSNQAIGRIYQALLCRKGYWEDKIDGIYDAKMIEKIKSYQSNNRLYSSGLMDLVTLNSLVK